MSFTVDPDTGDFFVVFYCDRIKLPMLLEQLDLAEATGEGTVSGKIPLQYKNGEIIFQDGFLYSSPGDKGTISVKKAKYLSTGIPKGTARFAQVELALEALKSFQYQWAKVIMQTLEKDLLLKIQFNGQPTKPLPFQYSKEIGGFIRVGPEKQKSKSQEIQLDVNFRLPLKKLLELKNIIQLLSS
jgi:hypothetical protein